MKKLNLLPGGWLGEKGRLNTKRATALTFLVRRDPDSLYGIDATVYVERVRDGAVEYDQGRIWRKAYKGMRALRLARTLDIALRGHTLAVFPYLTEGGRGALQGETAVVGVYEPRVQTKPWQYTMVLQLNTVPKYRRVWSEAHGGWVEGKIDHGQE